MAVGALSHLAHPAHSVRQTGPDLAHWVCHAAVTFARCCHTAENAGMAGCAPAPLLLLPPPPGIAPAAPLGRAPVPQLPARISWGVRADDHAADYHHFGCDAGSTKLHTVVLPRQALLIKDALREELEQGAAGASPCSMGRSWSTGHGPSSSLEAAGAHG